MSMPIQRQSEQFSVFDTGTRWERDRPSHELPRGLAGLVNSMGRSISAGLLNTRTAGEKVMPWTAGDWEGAEQFSGDYPEDAYRNHPDSWSHQPTEQDYADWEARHPHLANSRTAVNTDGMDPNEHAYGRQSHDPLFGEFGHDGYDYEGVSPRQYREMTRDYDPDEASQMAREDEDDESGYNWGPVPPEHLGARRGSGRLPFDRTAAGVDSSGVRPGPLVDIPLYDQDPDDYFGRKPYSGPFCEDCGRPTQWVSGPDCRHASLHRCAADAAVMDPAQMQMPIAGGYQLGHRVGLPWRNNVIPGTVIALNNEGPTIRWDDGQYSTEEPRNIQLL